jgi:O-antigen/teichoic acid export membrane protein
MGLMPKRTTFFITLALLFNNALPLITFPILTKTFDITSYGIWIEAGTLVSLVVVFANQGISNALGMLIANSSEEDRDSLYSNALYTFLVISGVLVIALNLLAPALNNITMRNPVGIPILRLLSLQIIFFALNSLLFQIYRMKHQAFKGTLLDVTMSISRFISVLTTIFLKDLIVFATIYVALQACVTIVQFIVSYRAVHFTKPSFSIMKQLVTSGFDLSIVSQANWLVMYGDRLMLSILSTSTAVAIYAASYQLTLVINALGYPYLYLLLPILGEHWKQNDITGGKQSVKNTTRTIGMIVIPCVIGAGLAGDTLLRFLATKEFAQGGLLIGMIAAGIVLDIFGTALQYIFYAQNRPQVLRNIYLRAALFNILANLIAIPLFSYNGAGLTTMLTFIYIFYSLWQKTEMPFTDLFDVNAMWRCLLASIVMGIWVVATVRPTIIGLIVAIIGGAVIYGIGIITLKVISLNELLAIPRSVLRRINRPKIA